MLHISVIDIDAEQRLRTVRWLEDHLRAGIDGCELFPQVSITPLSVSELKFNRTPDILFIGLGISTGALGEILRVCKIIPDLPTVAIVPSKNYPVTSIEYLARIGIAHPLSVEATTAEVIRCLVIITAQLSKKTSSQCLLVEAAKGGVGATTVVAAMAELLCESGKRVLVIDGDGERQSLSRFLNARPFLNQPLQTLLEGGHPVTSEFVEQCCVQIWHDFPMLRCMPPPVIARDAREFSGEQIRLMISIFEILDEQFDIIIADASGASGVFRRMLYRAADQVAIVTDSDPAAAYSVAFKLQRLCDEMTPQARLTMIENQRSFSLSPGKSLLRQEFERVEKIEAIQWGSRIPYCHAAQCWPGSGYAPFSLASKKMKLALKQNVIQLGLFSAPTRARTKIEILLRRAVRAFAEWVWRIVDTVGDGRKKSQIAYRARRELPKARPQLSWKPIIGDAGLERIAR